MKHDILIVGAGPVGCVAAGNLARQGHSVILLEEHRVVGKPMQCGGLISPRLRELVEFPVEVQNSVRGAIVHSPSGKEFILSAKQEKGIVIDRTEFDQSAASWAVEQGATIVLGSRVRSIVVKEDRAKGGFGNGLGNGVRVTTSSGDVYSSEMILGADGPSSVTARAASLPPIKVIVSGFEIEAVGKPLEKSMVEVYTGHRVGEGFFSWVIPFGEDRVRIGSGVHGNRYSALESLRFLIRESRHSSRFSGIQPISLHGGAIPMGMRDRIFADRLMVLGDAAGLAKPVSGGGVVTGIISAGIAADIADHCLTQETFSVKHTALYQRKLQATLGKELKRASKLRSAFMHLPDKELESLFSLLTKPKILRKINEKGDIDYPGRMAMELLRSSPGLLKFAIKYLGASTL